MLTNDQKFMSLIKIKSKAVPEIDDEVNERVF
jgi:hypothetical protein